MNTVCAELTQGYDLSCKRTLPKKYVQEAVAINFNDVDKTASTVGLSGANCDYTAQMVLKSGKSGVLIKLPDNGSSIKGFFNKSKNDLGFIQYLHQVQILVAGATKEVKCTLDKLDRGKYIFAVKLSDGTIEIYGWEYGISTGDYTYDIQEGGGGSLVILQSDEKAQEGSLPLVYKSSTLNGEAADFEALFEQP